MFDEARADFKKAIELANHGQDYSQPNFNMSSYLSPGNGTTAAIEFTGKEKKNNKRMPLSAATDNCYFCCSVISMSYGFYAAPDNLLNACNCLRHELETESKAPSENTVEANIAFMNGFSAIHQEDFEKAKQIIEEYARTISPELKSQKNEAHNFLEGLIYVGQENCHKALASFNKSDVNNIFVKYNLGLVYNNLEMYEEAKKAFAQVADFKFANAGETQMAKTANSWMKSYEDALLAGK
jgi:tetratricopeptide (TPR) repeat protein